MEKEIKEKSLLDLPDEMINKIYTFLDGVDFLTLRRVCWRTKYLVEDFMGDTLKWNKFEISLKKPEAYQKYVEFSENGFKFPNIRIGQYEEDPNSIPFVREFLDRYGPSIKKLRVGRFSGCQNDEEFNFFLSFPNLEEFQIQRLNLNEKDSTKPKIPPNFKNLKVLNLKGTFWHFWSCSEQEVDYNWELAKFCIQTQILFGPQFEFDYQLHDNLGIEQYFEKLKTIVEDGERASNGTPIKCIDLIKLKKREGLNFDSEDMENIQAYSPSLFLNFVEFCLQRGIKLQNVDAFLLEGVAELRPPTPKEPINKSVFSLKGFNHDCALFSWDNLDSLTIDRIDTSNRMHFYKRFPPPTLPNLTLLTLNFHSRESSRVVNKLLGILFPEDYNVWRKSLTEINLNLNHYVRKELTSRIVKNAPNLKKLKIKGWNLKNWQWGALFQRLKHLEELCVEWCWTFTDAVLIGEDPNNPIFLHLTGLKKLTLMLEVMGGLTDVAFKEVFSKMNLSELHLSTSKESCIPIASVTREGIMALAEGPFGRSVRKFPFKGFSLKGVSSQEFHELEMLFPCNR